MPVFLKPFKGIVSGDRYARDFFAGEECPENLIDEARMAGAIEAPKPKEKTSKS